MSKGTAVAGAISAQLHYECHWPPINLNKVLEKDYHYDKYTITNFLLAIRWRLAHSTPQYFFTFDADFALSALAMTVGKLTGAIESKTTATQPVAWVQPKKTPLGARKRKT